VPSTGSSRGPFTRGERESEVYWEVVIRRSRCRDDLNSRRFGAGKAKPRKRQQPIVREIVWAAARTTEWSHYQCWQGSRLPRTTTFWWRDTLFCNEWRTLDQKVGGSNPSRRTSPETCSTITCFGSMVDARNTLPMRAGITCWACEQHRRDRCNRYLFWLSALRAGTLQTPPAMGDRSSLRQHRNRRQGCTVERGRSSPGSGQDAAQYQAETCGPG